MKTFDAIIVGSGAGGGTAAYNLTKRGFNVLVLEKGDWSKAEDFLPYDELRFLEHKTLTPGLGRTALLPSMAPPGHTYCTERIHPGTR